jgi:hypothetical protein
MLFCGSFEGSAVEIGQNPLPILGLEEVFESLGHSLTLVALLDACSAPRQSASVYSELARKKTYYRNVLRDGNTTS